VAMASTLLLQSTMGFLRPSTALPATRVAAAAGLRLSQTRRSMAMISTETTGAADTEEFRVFFNVGVSQKRGAWRLCRLWVGGVGKRELRLAKPFVDFPNSQDRSTCMSPVNA